MSNFSNVVDAGKARFAARLSLVALTSIGVLGCEHIGASSGEGSLEIVSLGQHASAVSHEARGTITVRGLDHGDLHLVSTSRDAGTRTLRLAPGLYSVTPATELQLEAFEPSKAPRVQGAPALVRIDPGALTIVRVRFESQDANTLAAGQRELRRGARDYQKVSGSLEERAQVCRPTANGCDEPSASEPSLSVHGGTERRVLGRNPL